MGRPRKGSFKRGAVAPKVSSIADLKVGTPNVLRHWKLSSENESPQIGFRQCLNSFKYGFSAADDITSQDSTSAIDITVAANANLSAITPIATAFSQQYWPVIDNLLSAGVGSRAAVTHNSLARYMALVSEVVEGLMLPLSLNHMLNKFDWTKVPPFQPNPPIALVKLVNVFNASDAGMHDIWYPLMARLSNKVLPPAFTEELCRCCFPMTVEPAGHCIWFNTHYGRLVLEDAGLDLTIMTTRIEAVLDYLEDELSDVHNVLATFLPYRVGILKTMFRGYDPTMDDAFYNSTFASFEGFGDTGDPSIEDCMIVGTGAPASNIQSVPYYHTSSILTIRALARTMIYDVIYNALDNNYMNMSNVQWGPGNLIDDDLSYIKLSSAQLADSASKKAKRFFHSRFVSEDGAATPDNGRSEPGRITSMVSYEEILRYNQAYFLGLIGLSSLRTVSDTVGGSSLKVINRSLASVWQQSLG